MDELKWIEAALKGDLGAFNQLAVSYQEMAYNQAFWILRNEEAAEDITQEAFIQVYQKLKQFRGGSFRAWLLRIVTNASLDELRRQKRRPTVSLTPEYPDEEDSFEDLYPDTSPSPEDVVEQREQARRLWRALDHLPQDYRMVILLVDLHELGYDEAAGVLSIPVGTVKSRLARARVSLREYLKSQGQADGGNEDTFNLLKHKPDPR
jgi:RNA polymerase sigma-70 factor, ECF subfamily